MAGSDNGGLIGLMRSLTLDDWITPSMDEFFGRHQQEYWASASCYLHPSGIVDPCQRSVELGLLGHHSAVDARLGRIFDNGKSMHERWTLYFAEAGTLAAWDIKLTSNDPLTAGTADLIVRRPTDLRNEVLLGDLKSIGTQGFKALPTPGDTRANLVNLAKHHPRYVGQLLTYLRACPIRMDGFLLFEDKNTQDYKVYLITYDETMWQTLTANAVAAQAACCAGRLIPPPFLRGHANCRACWHQGPCFALQDGNADLAKEIDRRLRKARKT